MATFHKQPPGFPCETDRKSTRLNSSHGYISYAVFCLKKKKKKEITKNKWKAIEKLTAMNEELGEWVSIINAGTWDGDMVVRLTVSRVEQLRWMMGGAD